MKKILFVSFLSFLISCQYSNKNMLGYDIRLFHNTPVWELAKATKAQDTVKMKRLIEKHKLNIDFQEPKFGKTLLMLATYNQWISSVEILLRAGADPNLPDNYNGENAIIEASKWGPGYEDNPELLKLMLRYGGNPNYVTVSQRLDYKGQTTPLKVASGQSFAKTKILVEAGADINYMPPGSRSAVGDAALMGRQESPYILKYLLDNGGDCNTIINVTFNGDTLRLSNSLRTWHYPIESEEYQAKMEIVRMLKVCGQDYWKVPIPKDYYKLYDDDYLRQY